jgi:putative heme-binding domain-containing protein
MMGIRAAIQLRANVMNVVRQLANDPDIQVRRECLLALYHNKSPEAATTWSALARMYDGKDRWYLEALGIAADQQWDTFFPTFVTGVKDPLQNAPYRDIVWRARTEKAIPYIAQMAAEENVNLKDRLRYFRAFDFNTGTSKRKLLLDIIAKNEGLDTAENKIVLRHLDIPAVKSSPVATKALNNVLRALEGTSEYIDLIERYDIRTENKNLLQLAINHSRDPIGKSGARLLLKYNGDALAWQIIKSKDSSRANPLLRALGGAGTKESIDLLQSIVLSKNFDTATRGLAARVIGKSWDGEERVLQLLKKKQVEKQLIPSLVASVSGAWRGSVRSEAASYLPGANKVVETKAPPLNELLAMKVSPENGFAVFQRACATCHVMNKDGFDFGPKLSEIGSKFPKDGLYRAIVYPSENISFGYEGWEIKMKDGSTLSGIISSRTATNIDLKLPGGTKMQLKTSEVKSTKQIKESLMPSGLHQAMSKQEFAQLLGYLANAKKKQ